MSESSILVSHLHIADPDGLVGAIRGGELEPWALSGHPGESELLRVLLPGSCLDQARLGPAMWFRGAMPEPVHQMPEAFTSVTARDALESELHDHYFGLIRRDRGNGAAATNPGIARRYLRMGLVRDFIRDHSHRRISLAELCAVSGLSRRGIEYLFLDVFGVRVSAFLLRLRLHGVRRALLAAEPRHGLVKQCALGWGFWHLGRFAAEYRVLFGENPSATLARRA